MSNEISMWKADGLPPKKIVMGMPACGREWQLKDPNQHKIRAPAAGIWQEATLGVMNCSVIVEFNRENNAMVVSDNGMVSAYTYAGTDWIGYDDATTVEYKVKFAKAQGLSEHARAAPAAWDGN